MEISAESAQELVNAILAALEEGSKEHGDLLAASARVGGFCKILSRESRGNHAGGSANDGGFGGRIRST